MAFVMRSTADRAAAEAHPVEAGRVERPRRGARAPLTQCGRRAKASENVDSKVLPA